MYRFCTNHLEFVNGKIQNVKIRKKEAMFSFNIKYINSVSDDKSKSDKVASNSTTLKNNKVLVKSKMTNKFYSIAKNLTSFSIFGSEITDPNCGIKYEGTDKNLSIPSVTYILRETMSSKAKQALELWKKRIVDVFGEKYFIQFCKELLNDGRLFHSCIQDTLLQRELTISPRAKSAYFSVKPVLDDIKSVQAVEARVVHPTLRYKGIVDCIACYRDNMYVIDWKKSQKQKTNLAATFDAPVQLAAYIGAVNASNMYPSPIDRGLVIVGYTNGDAASIHELHEDALQKAWEEWLRRLQLFYSSLNKQIEQHSN